MKEGCSTAASSTNDAATQDEVDEENEPDPEAQDEGCNLENADLEPEYEEMAMLSAQHQEKMRLALEAKAALVAEKYSVCWFQSNRNHRAFIDWTVINDGAITEDQDLLIGQEYNSLGA